MQKPRCPRCKKPARALYERHGSSAIAKRVHGWATCSRHGPFRMRPRVAPPAGLPESEVYPVAA